jgi:uncharacterized damage-inducible protein DinB
LNYTFEIGDRQEFFATIAYVMDTQAFVTHVRYTAWATRRVLDSAAALKPEELQQDLGNSYGGVFGTLAHIFQGDSIWFDRLQGKTTGSLAAYTPSADFAQFSMQWRDVLDRFVEWAEKLGAADWDQICKYRNTQGEAFATPVWQVVVHVVNHASYHRGQITTMLRQVGHTPIGTDLIAYYRELK